MLNTFLKLHQTKKENCILYCVLIDQRETIESRINVINWSSKVRNLLQNAGFGDVWLFPDSVNFKSCIPVLRDSGERVWQFVHHYTCLENLKQFLSGHLRLSSHKLNIEIGRHNNIDRQDRKCIICNLNDIEDEFHFVLVCPDYINLRNAYIPK